MRDEGAGDECTENPHAHAYSNLNRSKKKKCAVAVELKSRVWGALIWWSSKEKKKKKDAMEKVVLCICIRGKKKKSHCIQKGFFFFSHTHTHESSRVSERGYNKISSMRRHANRDADYLVSVLARRGFASLGERYGHVFSRSRTS